MKVRSDTSAFPWLKLLQLGDSFFPSGANVFSHGLEGLRAAGRLPDAASVQRFVHGQIEHRWAHSDRVAVAHAHARAHDLTRLCQLDRFVDRSTSAESWRTGGRRLGRALLRVHESLGTPGAAEYAALVRAERAPGQASAVHGLIARAQQLEPGMACALSGYGLAVSLVGAALRLGALGHLDAQRVLSAAVERIAAWTDEPVPALEDFASWLPEAEIASMQQEARYGRLFAN